MTQRMRKAPAAKASEPAARVRMKFAGGCIVAGVAAGDDERTAILAALERQLRRGDKALVGNAMHMVRYVSGKSGLRNCPVLSVP